MFDEHVTFYYNKGVSMLQSSFYLIKQGVEL
jgi:hypothetical protein